MYVRPLGMHKKFIYKCNFPFLKLTKKSGITNLIFLFFQNFLEVQVGHLGMHKKLYHKSDFTLIKSFWMSTHDILGMHEKHWIRNLFQHFSKLTGSPLRTFWECLKNQITNLISLLSKLIWSPPRTICNSTHSEFIDIIQVVKTIKFDQYTWRVWQWTCFGSPGNQSRHLLEIGFEKTWFRNPLVQLIIVLQKMQL
jgi:hypothetical protein